MRLARRFGWPAVAAVAVLVVLLALPEIPTPRALGIWVVLATAIVLFVLALYAPSFEPPEAGTSYSVLNGLITLLAVAGIVWVLFRPLLRGRGGPTSTGGQRLSGRGERVGTPT